MPSYDIRIPPLAPEAFSPEQKALVGDWSSMHFCTVLVRHPQLYKVFLPYIEQLIAHTTLPPRDREVLVLRSLAVANDVYESHHHALIARNAGMSDSEIAACRTDGAGLTDVDRLLMTAVDELMHTHYLSDPTWQALAQHYTESQMIEVIFLVGCYTLMGMVTNSLGIPLEAADDEFTHLRDYT